MFIMWEWIMNFFKLLVGFVGSVLSLGLNAGLHLQFKKPISALNFSLDGHHLVLGVQREIYLIGLHNNSIGIPYDFYQKTVTSVAFDGTLLFVGYEDGTLVIKDVRFDMHSHVYANKAHRGKISIIQCTKSYIVTASEDNTVCIWRKDGSFVRSLQLPATITVLQLRNDGKEIYIGCQNGSVHFYRQSSQICHELVVNLHKGAVTCLALDSEGMFVGFENSEVVFFNFSDKSVKIFKASCPIQTLEIAQHDNVILGVSSSVDHVYIWDRKTGFCFDSHKNKARSQGRVIINGSRLAYISGLGFNLEPVSYRVKHVAIEDYTNGVTLDPLKIIDGAGCESGCLRLDRKNRASSMKICLWEPEMLHGNHVLIKDLYDRPIKFYFHYPLRLIQKLLLFREGPAGRLVIGYTESLDGKYMHNTQPDSCVTQLAYTSGAVHASLYSCNMAISAACLTDSKEGREPRSITSGVNLNGKGHVWCFDGQGSAPYKLFIISNGIRYAWHIPYLLEQAEFLLCKGKKNFPNLCQYDENFQQCFRLPMDPNLTRTFGVANVENGGSL